MDSEDTGVCHECERRLPLHEAYFYKSKGKWWIYRCIECSDQKNRNYYQKMKAGEGKLPRQKPRMARDVSLAQVTDEDKAAANLLRNRK